MGCCVCSPEEVRIHVTDDVNNPAPTSGDVRTPNINSDYQGSPEGEDTSTANSNRNDQGGENQALTLGDINVKNLKDGKPLYISSIVANNWRKHKEQKYCLLTMSPEGV